MTETTATPHASIIVPLHNSKAHLPQLIESLNAQTLAGFQAILVDDGSVDDTLDAVSAAVANDARFVVITQQNAGPGAARNRGLDAAEGEYVAFMDADDSIEPTYLEDMVNTAQANHADMCICQMRQKHVQTKDVFPSPDRWPAQSLPATIAPEDIADDLFGTFRNWPFDKLFKRSFLVEHGIRFPKLYRTEDLAFTCSALAKARTIALLDRELYTYHVGSPTSSTATRQLAPLDFLDSCLILKRFLDDNGLMDAFRRSFTQWVGLCCVLNLAELRQEDAFKQIWKALHSHGLKELGIRSPRLPARPFARQTAAGCVTDEDVEAALKVIERHGVLFGAKRLRRIMDEASFRGTDGQERQSAGILLYPAGREQPTARG